MNPIIFLFPKAYFKMETLEMNAVVVHRAMALGKVETIRSEEVQKLQQP